MNAIKPFARVNLRGLLLGTAAPLALGLALAGQAQAQALPTPDNPGGWVNVGTDPGYTNAGPNGSVTVTGSRAYATWTDFNVIGGSFTVNGQLDPSWILVNRVTGADASLISGTISATGQVWLINQNGITATSSAVFDVGGLLMSTASTFDEVNFLTGGTAWTFNDAVGNVVFNGTVNSTGGVVAFIAPNISFGGTINEGSVGATDVLMLAAESVSLSFDDANGDLVYELDNVVATRGVSTGGVVTLDPGSAVNAGHIVIGAVGNGATSQIIVSGLLNATVARGDGQDILLIAPDNAGPGSEQLIYANGLSQTLGTATGGDIVIDNTAVIQTLAGGGLTVSAAGDITTGDVSTVGSLTFTAFGNILGVNLSSLSSGVSAQAQGNILLGDVSAGTDIGLGSANGIIDVLNVTADRDVVIVADTGTVATGSIQAGDDVVLRAGGALTVTGSIDAGTVGDAVGLADGLSIPDQMTLFGRLYGDFNNGSDIDVRAGGDVVVTGNATAAGIGGDARVQSTGGTVQLAAVAAGGDVGLDGAAITAAGLTAGRDIAARASAGNLILTSAQADDDVVLRGSGSIMVTGALSARGLVDGAGAGDDLVTAAPALLFGTANDVSGRSDIDLAAGAGITVNGATTAVGAGSDVRIQSSGGALLLANVGAGDDIGLSGSSIGAGTLTAGRDIAAQASAGNIVLVSVNAGDDVVMRALMGRIQATGGLAAGLGGDALGLGDSLSGLAPNAIFGLVNLVTDGSDVDLVARDAIVVGGAISAAGAGGDVRAEIDAATGLALNLQAVTAGGEIGLRGPSITTGALVAGGDVAVDSTGGLLDIVSIQAGDDVVLDASGPVRVRGAISTGTGADSLGLGDQLAPGLDDGDLSITSGSSVTIDGAIDASGALSDVTIDAFGAVTTVGISADRDIDVDGGGDVTLGGVDAGRDAALRSREGNLGLTSVRAQDDVVLRAGGGSVTVNGVVSALGTRDEFGAGDALAVIEPSALFGMIHDLTGGSDIDISARNSITIGGMTAASGDGSDVRLRTLVDPALAGVQLGAVSAGRDVSIDAARVLAGTIGAGRDVAINSRNGGNLTVGAVTAADDIVLRGGRVATGALTASGPETADLNQAGDLLAAIDPVNLNGSRSAGGGAHVDIRATGLVSTGVVQAGGDARIQTTNDVIAGNVSAGRDVLLDGAQVSAGVVTAQRDVALWARTGVLFANSVAAGDDVALRAGGPVIITGGVTAGGQADQAGDADALVVLQPAAMFGVINPLSGADIDVSSGSGVSVGGAALTTGVGSDVRVNAFGAINLGDVSAGRDIALDGDSVNAGIVTATARDIAVRSRQGTLVLTSASAGDDVVLRAPGGSVTVNGVVSAGLTGDSTGVGDHLATLNPTVLFGVSHGVSGGSDVDVSARNTITVSGATTALGTGSDARLATHGVVGQAIQLAGVSAGGDIGIDGSAVVAGALDAERDVAVLARSGTLTLTSVEAADDVVLRAAGALNVTGAINALGSLDAAGTGDALATASPAALFGVTHDLAGSDIDIQGGSVTLGGATGAVGLQSDIRVQGGTIVTSGLVAGRDVGVDGTSVSVGAVVAGRDVAARASAGALSLASVQADDDVVLRASGALTVTGAINARGLIDGAGVGEDLASVAPAGLFGVTHDLTGSDVDLSSGGAVSLAATSATGSQGDVRLQGGALVLTTVNAGRDIGIDATSINAGSQPSTAALTAGRDVALRTTGDMRLASLLAGDDAVLRSGGAVDVSGAVAAGGGADGLGVGDTLAGLVPAVLFSGPADSLTGGGDVDVLAGSSVTVVGATSATGAGSDVRIQTAAAGGLAVQLGDVTAGRDIGLDGSAVTAGRLDAGRDAAVRARSGAISLASVEADDDVVLRASGAVSVTGAVTAGSGTDALGAGDTLALLAPAALFGVTHDLTGGDVDINGGSVTLSGATGAAGLQSDIRVQGGTIVTSGLVAGRDVGVDGTSVSGGAVVAGRDVAARASAGALSLASVQADDDVVLRASGALTVTGAINARGLIDGAGVGEDLASVAPAGLFGVTHDLTGSDVDLSSGGAVSLAATSATGSQGDVRLQGGALVLTTVNAGRDIGIDAASINAGSQPSTAVLTAGRDVALRTTGEMRLASVLAGDDAVLRSGGLVNVSGAVGAGGGADGLGVGDTLAGLVPVVLFSGPADSLTGGGDVDVLAGSSVTIAGATSATGAGSDVRIQTAAAGGLAVQLGGVTAGGDIGIDGSAVSAGALVAGRDIAVWARSGALNLASVQAGDDVVLRAAGAVTVTGAVSSLATSDSSGLGDRLRPLGAGTSQIALTGQALTGSDINIVGAEISLGGAVSTAGANGDVRLETTGSSRGAITVAGALSTGGATSEIAIHGGQVTLASVTGIRLRLAASNVTLGGVVNLSATGTADIFADTSGGVVIGTGSPVTGETFRLDNTEVGNIRAARLSIFSSVPGGTSRPMTLQDLTFRDPASVGFANAVRNIALYTNGQRIDVTGAVTGAGGNLTLGSPENVEGFGWRPSVVRVSGTIGTSAARMGSVLITAGDIYIAPRGETIDIESGTPLPVYAGPLTVQIAATSLTLDATRTIQQRNLQSNVFTLTNGLGLEVESLTISGPTLTQVSLFGQLLPPGEDQIVDIAAALAIRYGNGRFNVSFTPTPGTANNFRFNTCVIGGGGGCAVFLAPFAVPALPDPDELGDLTDPYAIVDDEPVTSSGGEILWPSPDDTDDEDEEEEDGQ